MAWSRKFNHWQALETRLDDLDEQQSRIEDKLDRLLALHDTRAEKKTRSKPKTDQ